MPSVPMICRAHQVQRTQIRFPFHTPPFAVYQHLNQWSCMPDLPPHHELSITIARLCMLRMRIKVLAKTLWRGQVREPSELTMSLQTDL